MDAMTLFMLVLLGMTFPIVAILAAVLFDVAVIAWMAVDAAFRGLTDFGHTIRVRWIHAAHP
jgi:hypothetical protein